MKTMVRVALAAFLAFAAGIIFAPALDPLGTYKAAVAWARLEGARDEAAYQLEFARMRSETYRVVAENAWRGYAKASAAKRRKAREEAFRALGFADGLRYAYRLAEYEYQSLNRIVLEYGEKNAENSPLPIGP